MAGDKVYYVAYYATPDSFGLNFPDVQDIVDSLRITR